MRIWQVRRNHPRRRELLFAGWEFRREHEGEALRLADYEVVWEEPDPPGGADPEAVYERFNLERPAGFRGHSLSISDLVETGGRFYYCDTVGFVDVSDRVVG
ncbi:MAG: hypothetical protein K6U87_15410 [Firmicutes bacterium]|nr:hypothetical protein [Bacillota bacterium]